jgi:hypothetical protein
MSSPFWRLPPPTGRRTFLYSLVLGSGVSDFGLSVTGNSSKFDSPITKLHAEAATPHQEQLVLGLVLMPDELPLELDDLHLLAV